MARDEEDHYAAFVIALDDLIEKAKARGLTTRDIAIELRKTADEVHPR